MATGHLDPGYGNAVSRLRRARTTLPAGWGSGARPGAQSQLEGYQDLDDLDLEDIRDRAKDTWLQANAFKMETSYMDHYPSKNNKLDDLKPSRPASSSRRNNPHPSE